MAEDNSLDLPICALCQRVAARCSCCSIWLGVRPDGYSDTFCSPTSPLCVWLTCAISGPLEEAGLGWVLGRRRYPLAEGRDLLTPASDAWLLALSRVLDLVERGWGTQPTLELVSDHADPLLNGASSSLRVQVERQRAAFPRCTWIHTLEAESALLDRARELARDVRRRAHPFSDQPIPLTLERPRS